MSEHDFFDNRILQGDYYDINTYNPNHVFDDVNGRTSEVIKMADSLLADESLDSRASHGGEAYIEGDILMCERQFSLPEGGEEVYGGRPVWQHVTVSYYEDSRRLSKIYDIITSVSVGGVHHQMLKNRYTLGLSGNDNQIVDATAKYPDVVYDGMRKRLMTSYDLDQALDAMASMKRVINQHKDAR